MCDTRCFYWAGDCFSLQMAITKSEMTAGDGMRGELKLRYRKRERRGTEMGCARLPSPAPSSLQDMSLQRRNAAVSQQAAFYSPSDVLISQRRALYCSGQPRCFWQSRAARLLSRKPQAMETLLGCPLCWQASLPHPHSTLAASELSALHRSF